MRESGYYPPGAEFDPDAPWNQEDVPEKEFEVLCSQTLSKTVIVVTSDYIPGASGVDYEPDDEGGVYASGWQDPDDTSDTNWAKEYHDNDYHTPLQLITLFGEFLKEQMSHGIVFKSPKYTESLIKECEGWEEDDIAYERD